MNKAVLIGRLGADPEIRKTQSGDSVVTMNLATSESWKDKEGNRKESTEWHRVVIFNKGLCRVAGDYLKKGSQVAIEGQIKTRKWTDKEGQEKYTTEIVIGAFGGNLELLGGRGESKEAEPRNAPVKAATTTAEDMSDEIPF